MGRSIAGWKIGPEERDRLLARFPPRYERRVADHVTLRFGTDADTPLPAETEARIVGEADDDAGVHALVVAIGGTIARGDGSHFHITCSLVGVRSAQESNDVIAASDWQGVSPVRIALPPRRGGEIGRAPGR